MEIIDDDISSPLYSVVYSMAERWGPWWGADWEPGVLQPPAEHHSHICEPFYLFFILRQSGGGRGEVPTENLVFYNLLQNIIRTFANHSTCSLFYGRAVGGAVRCRLRTWCSTTSCRTSSAAPRSGRESSPTPSSSPSSTSSGGAFRRSSSSRCTDKKENEIFLIYKEI